MCIRLDKKKGINLLILEIPISPPPATPLKFKFFTPREASHVKCPTPWVQNMVNTELGGGGGGDDVEGSY